MLTLNNAAPDAEREPQFYPGCVQVTISGGDSTAKPATVSIPGYLTIESPGLLYNIWTSKDYSDYKLPGPAPLAESSSTTEDSDDESTSPEPEAPEVKPSAVPEPTFSSATIIPTTTHTTPFFTDIVNPSDLPTPSPLLPSPTLLPTLTAEVPFPSFSADPLPAVSSPVDSVTTIVTATGTRPAAGTGGQAAPTPTAPAYKWRYGNRHGGKPRGRFGAKRYGGH